MLSVPQCTIATDDVPVRIVCYLTDDAGGEVDEAD